MPSDDFLAFLGYAELIARNARRELQTGNIRPSPYDGSCDYCAYRGACGFVGAARKESKVEAKDITAIVRKEEQV